MINDKPNPSYFYKKKGPTTFSLGNTIGFDDVLSEISKCTDLAFSYNKSEFPPHNVIKLDEANYTIEMALAGYKRNELDISIKDNKLVVKTIKTHDENEEVTNFLHRGISKRAFVRTFKLAKFVEVKGAKLEDGILTVTLFHNVPKEKEPVQISIE